MRPFLNALQLSPIPIDASLALKQHNNYISLLKTIPGINVEVIPADDDLPDCNFIEDTAVFVNSLRIGIIPIIGAVSRQPETPIVEQRIHDVISSNKTSLQPYEIFKLKGDALVDGGDVFITPYHVFVGLSTRTNEEGFQQIKSIVDQAQATVLDTETATSRVAIEVVKLHVTAGLHLKSVLSILDSDVLVVCQSKAGRDLKHELTKLGLVQSTEASTEEIRGAPLYILIEVKDQPFSNVLRVRNTVVLQEGFDESDDQKVRAACEERKFDIKSLPMSELIKADGCLTCGNLLMKLN